MIESSSHRKPPNCWWSSSTTLHPLPVPTCKLGKDMELPSLALRAQLPTPPSAQLNEDLANLLLAKELTSPPSLLPLWFWLLLFIPRISREKRSATSEPCINPVRGKILWGVPQVPLTIEHLYDPLEFPVEYLLMIFPSTFTEVSLNSENIADILCYYHGFWFTFTLTTSGRTPGFVSRRLLVVLNVV